MTHICRDCCTDMKLNYQKEGVNLMTDDVIETVYAGAMIDRAVGLCTTGTYAGWLLAKHPDGQWVTIADLSKYFLIPPNNVDDKEPVVEAAATAGFLISKENCPSEYKFRASSDYQSLERFWNIAIAWRDMQIKLAMKQVMTLAIDAYLAKISVIQQYGSGNFSSEPDLSPKDVAISEAVATIAKHLSLR